MENLFAPYECQFSPQERKRIVAQTLRELRKLKNYSQKELAGILGLSQPGYNGYETGRTEPPLEILVRLSYLYKVPVDLIVQKDRLYRTTTDINDQITKMNMEIDKMAKELDKSDLNNPMAQQIIESMKMLAEGMQKYSEQPSIKEQIEEALDQSDSK